MPLFLVADPAESTGLISIAMVALSMTDAIQLTLASIYEEAHEKKKRFQYDMITNHNSDKVLVILTKHYEFVIDRISNGHFQLNHQGRETPNHT